MIGLPEMKSYEQIKKEADLLGELFKICSERHIEYVFETDETKRHNIIEYSEEKNQMYVLLTSILYDDVSSLLETEIEKIKLKPLVH